MATTGRAGFDATVQKTNELLHAIADANGWPREPHDRSYDALRGVLHALRDRLTVEETAQMAAQLPVLVRGLFYEGWDPTHVPVKMDREAFVERSGCNEEEIRTVLQALRRFVSDGEWDDIAAIVPMDLNDLLPV
jgi:uncharacterized protein (DUF2267 family)